VKKPPLHWNEAKNLLHCSFVNWNAKPGFLLGYYLQFPSLYFEDNSSVVGCSSKANLSHDGLNTLMKKNLISPRGKRGQKE
jgi:hypothetical protein